LKFKLSDLWKSRPRPGVQTHEPHAVEAREERPASESAAREVSDGRTPDARPSKGREVKAKPDVDLAALLKIKLPPLPNAALRIADLTRDSNASASTIADAIGYDPFLAARILRAANSSLYTRERHVTALTTAVNVLGARALYQLVISYAASSLFEKPSSRSHLERELWKHSVFVGLAARVISLEMSRHGSEEAFLCGLLHDIGKALMIRQNHELYAPLAEITEEKELLEKEQEVYGFTHPQVSALVVNQWGLAPEISDAILNHHEPDEAIHSILITRSLNIANKLANAAGYGLCQESSETLAADESVFLLGLTEERLREIRERAEEGMSEMMSILSR